MTFQHLKILVNKSSTSKTKLIRNGNDTVCLIKSGLITTEHAEDSHWTHILDAAVPSSHVPYNHFLKTVCLKDNKWKTSQM